VRRQSIKTGRVSLEGVPDKLQAVFNAPYGSVRYRGAYGGRGSGKTFTFAKMVCRFGQFLADTGREGSIICAREFQNSLSESSYREIAGAIHSDPVLAGFYEVGENFIRSRCRRIDFQFVGLRHNLESLKSRAKVLLCWVDEAEPVRDQAWEYLIPTVREPGSEIWLTFNPGEEGSATDLRFRKHPPENSLIVECNWQDNPFFPDVLDQERRSHLARFPKSYDHVWNGGYRVYSDDALFREDWLGKYEYPILGLSEGVLRIGTAMTGDGDFHGIVALGYTSDKSQVHVLDACRAQLDFPNLVDWVIEYVQHAKSMENKVFKLRRIVIEKANVGDALAASLKVKFAPLGIRVGVAMTPKYGSKFDRAREAAAFFEQGRVLFPNGFTPWQLNRGEGIEALRRECLAFTETDTHATDDLVDPLIWEVVSQYGNADPNGRQRYWRSRMR